MYSISDLTIGELFTTESRIIRIGNKYGWDNDLEMQLARVRQAIADYLA